MRGRKPKPTGLHKLQGTLNVTRHKGRTREPEAEGDLLATPPAWMTASQQAGWRHAVAHAPRGVMRQVDRGVLAIWVVAEDQHRTASVMQAELDQTTRLLLLTKNKDGTPGVSPYVTISHRAAATMLKAGSELGFSPAARPRLAAGALAPDALADEGAQGWGQLKVLQGGKAE
jgi:P27 family predicted phage terminase small subunit